MDHSEQHHSGHKEHWLDTGFPLLLIVFALAFVALLAGYSPHL
jgi:hypothetical protein